RKGGDKLADFKSAEYDELTKLNPAEGDVKRLVDRDGDGKITLKELRNFNLELRGRGMRLWGMMMPEVVTHTYQIL
ncbi:EF-hand domain-containing protein, partial [Pelotalea chapellei]